MLGQKAAAPIPSPKSLTSPLLYLSSLDAGWDGLVALAYHEPMELESYIAPATSNISLVLFAGAGMHMEQRHFNGAWRAYDMRQDDLILSAGLGTAYEVRWWGLSSAPTQTLHLHLSKNLLFQTAEELTGCDSSHLSLVGRVGFQDSLLAQIGFALWRELEQHSAGGKLYAQTAAQMLAVHLLRHYSSAGEIKTPTQGLTQRQVKQVTDFVRAHLTHDLSLDDLAKQVGFSAYHFARLFRQTMGESPHQFVLRQRVEKARRLLKESDRPLAAIAVESGFANQSHFTRIFKQQLGITPRTYRQEFGIRAAFEQDSQE